MMWKRNIAVGVFAAAGAALFASAVFLIGNQNSLFARHVEFYAEFRNLNGLVKGSKVRVGGFDAGEVREITVPDSPSAGFRLRLRLSERTRGLVRADSVAMIATEGMVGDQYVLIGVGSPAAPEAAPFSKIRSKEAAGMNEILAKG